MEDTQGEAFLACIWIGIGPADSGAQVGARMGVEVGLGVMVAVAVGVIVGVGVPSAKAVPTVVRMIKIKRAVLFIGPLSMLVCIHDSKFSEGLFTIKTSLAEDRGTKTIRNHMTSPKATYDVIIRESHLDIFGHMNNAAYLTLFEEARWDYITKNGYGLKKVQEIQQGPIVLELSLKFKREITLREKITITLEMLDFKEKISHYRQEMIKEDGTIATELVITFGLFDLKTRRLIDPTPEWKKAIGLP
jgi:YbgC/YbaW family acyl-CoA thioester hydrolase